MIKPNPAPGYVIERIVEGSGFHTANGLAFGPDGLLYVTSVLGESIFAIDVAIGAIEVAVPPFAGESDDLLFTSDGDLIWTALLEGVVRCRRANGTIQDLASGLPGANSIALTRDGKRLFVGQVFMGEGLWEIDLSGVAAPRLVADHTGGLNASQFGPDGMLYAPSWERGQVVRINPDSGETTILAEHFTKPGAVRFDAHDQLYVLDDATGELFALDAVGATYERRSIAKLATATDNVIFGPTGLAYVSNMVDNSIHEVDPATGRVRTLVEGKLGFPRAIALTADVGGDILHVADSCAWRTIDTRTLAIRDMARAVVSAVKFPTAVSATSEGVLLAGEAFGVIQLFDRDGKHVRDVEDFAKPSAALLLGDGSFLVAEPKAGRILQVRATSLGALITRILPVGAEQHTPLVMGLHDPVGLADASDGTVLVAESKTGRLLRIVLAHGTVSVVAEGLGRLRAVAVGPSGLIAVLDVDGGRVLTIHAETGEATVVADGMAVGYLTEPYPRSGGIAIGSDDAIYVAADRENAIYRIRREPRG